MINGMLRQKMLIIALLLSMYGTIFVPSASSQQMSVEAKRLNKLALQFYEEGKYDEALILAEQALKILRPSLGPDHRDVAAILNTLAIVYRVTGQYKKAEMSYIESLRIVKLTRGENHPDYATVLGNQAELYVLMGQYEQAEPLYLQSLRIMKITLGENDPEYIKILHSLAVLYKSIGQYEKAEPLYLRSNEVLKTTLGEDHPQYAVSLSDMAGLYFVTGRYEKAEPLYIRSLEIKRQTSGERHPEYALTLNNLGLLYKSMCKYEKAEQILTESLDIKKHTLSEHHPSYATGLHNLAELYYETGQYKKAEAFGVQSNNIIKNTLGENHLSYGKSLNSLAELYYSIGKYEKAEALCIQAEDVIRRAVGEDHPSYSRSLNNLAVLSGVLGQYEKSEQFFMRLLKIKRNIPIDNSSGHALSLNNLAGLYFEIGQYENAEQLIRQYLEIIKNRLGENHADYALGLHNLAQMYELRNQPENAERLIRQCLEIWKKTLGENHPYYASGLSNLAGLYEATGQTEKAESLLMQSMKIRREVLGENHPDYELSLSSLAKMYILTGQYIKAEELCIQAKNITRQAFGEDHPSYARNLKSLAALYAATNRPDEAISAITQSLQIEQNNINQVFGFSSESAMRAYLATINNSIDVLMSLCVIKQFLAPATVQTTLNWVLRRKAIILNSLIEFHQAEQLFKNNPKFAATKARYQYLSQQLSNLPLRKTKKLTEDAEIEFQQQMANFRSERASLQSELNRILSAQRIDQSLSNIDAVSLKRKLMSGTALIEFVRASTYNFKATGKEPRWNPPHYFAFVLAFDNKSPQMVDLGVAKVIDDAIIAIRNSIIEFGEKWEIDKPGLLHEAAQEKEYREGAKRLYDLIFAPLQKRLGSSKTIYISPDHQLSLIPFEALVDPGNRYLIENYRFAYLTSGRDLLREQTARSQGTMIFAYPDYDMKPDARMVQVQKLLDQNSAAATTENPPTQEQVIFSGKSLHQLQRRQTRGKKWERREATLKEAEDVERNMKTTAYSPIQKFINCNALEESFKRIKSPRLLHVSTHGFFPEEKEDSNRLQITSDKYDGNIATIGQQRLQLASIENPLLGCGLVLAGANTIRESKGQSELDDGWVTAEEIASMDLQGTELVVLSTCGSGLGKVSSGEGVYGLRRAFQSAGARTIVLTLFSIPDIESSELMKNFYEGLKAGRGKLESLRGAQLKIIKERRTKEGAAHPFFWASFILAGDID